MGKIKIAGEIVPTYIKGESIRGFVDVSEDKKHFRIKTYYDTIYPPRGTYLKREHLDADGQQLLDIYFLQEEECANIVI